MPELFPGSRGMEGSCSPALFVSTETSAPSALLLALLDLSVTWSTRTKSRSARAPESFSNSQGLLYLGQDLLVGF